MPLKKGDWAYYTPKYGTPDMRVRAYVRRAHRDNTVTVRALYFMDAHNFDVGPYIGAIYRMEQSRLVKMKKAVDSCT